jgi:hypothetical protein
MLEFCEACLKFTHLSVLFREGPPEVRTFCENEAFNKSYHKRIAKSSVFNEKDQTSRLNVGGTVRRAEYIHFSLSLHSFRFGPNETSVSVSPTPTQNRKREELCVTCSLLVGSPRVGKNERQLYFKILKNNYTVIRHVFLSNCPVYQHIWCNGSLVS